MRDAVIGTWVGRLHRAHAEQSMHRCHDTDFADLAAAVGGERNGQHEARGQGCAWTYPAITMRLAMSDAMKMTYV